MRARVRWLALVFLGAVAFPAMCFGQGKAGPPSAYGSVQMKWRTLPMIKMSVTPNYSTGFGPTGGVGSGSTPAPGPGAVANGGIVDFGSNVVQGYNYLYKHALEANVETNDLSGFTLYAEGTSAIVDTTATPSPATIPLNLTLFWLDSSAANTPFSAGTAFETTTSPTCGIECITYAGTPPSSAEVWLYPGSTMGLTNSTASQGFDYQLRLGNYPNPDSFTVYIVYTAVAN